VPALSITGIRWKSLFTSYPSAGIEVCEPEEAEGDDCPGGGEPGGTLHPRVIVPREGDRKRGIDGQSSGSKLHIGRDGHEIQRLLLLRTYR
jgi:hypothetical protein